MEEKEMMISFVGSLLGALIAGAGIYYLVE